MPTILAALALGVLLATLSVALCWAQPALADTFRPTRFDDPAPDRCRPNDCSLTEAIRDSASQPGHDRIILAAGTYERELLSGGTAGGTGGIDIRGQGPASTVIDANGMGAGIALGDLTTGSSSIEALKVTGGNLSTGGGIYVAASHVSIRDVLMSNNSATQGGGLYVDRVAHDVTVSHSAIAQNEASFGGGIRSFGRDVTIKKTSIEANNAGEGGGLDLRPGPVGKTSATTIRASTISGNFALKGAGLLADGQPTFDPEQRPPRVEFLNSTLAENSASAEGGGVLADNGAKVTLASSTVARNVADDDGTGGGSGGGVEQHSGAHLNLEDSVVGANVVGASGSGPQCAGSLAANAGTVLQTQAVACTVTGTPVLVGDPMLGPLGDNGGLTRTIELLSGSAAVANAESCPKHDQRGVRRPHSGCDSGAYERQGA